MTSSHADVLRNFGFSPFQRCRDVRADYGVVFKRIMKEWAALLFLRRAKDPIGQLGRNLH